MLEEAWKVNPNFWFEVSTWDGNELLPWMNGLRVEKPEDLAKKSSQPLTTEERARINDEDLKKAKVLQYMKDGQDYPPERAAGWAQFGIWLLRPRVVRQFYSSSTQLEPVKPYWMEVVRAVDRVYAHETLKEFWRFGELVPNKAHQHPYQTDVPEKYRNIDRWYLLDTSLDPERPWDRHTGIPVFSLALVRGSEGARKWLLYAHSPLKDRNDVQITIPNFKAVTVDVPRAGAFYLVDEKRENSEVVKTIF